MTSESTPPDVYPTAPERRRRRRTIRRGVLVLIAVVALVAVACRSADSGDETKGSASRRTRPQSGTPPTFPDGTKVKAGHP